jgi:hypothetical protein
MERRSLLLVVTQQEGWIDHLDSDRDRTNFMNNQNFDALVQERLAHAQRMVEKQQRQKLFAIIGGCVVVFILLAVGGIFVVKGFVTPGGTGFTATTAPSATDAATAASNPTSAPTQALTGTQTSTPLLTQTPTLTQLPSGTPTLTPTSTRTLKPTVIYYNPTNTRTPTNPPPQPPRPSPTDTPMDPTLTDTPMGGYPPAIP